MRHRFDDGVNIYDADYDLDARTRTLTIDGEFFDVQPMTHDEIMEWDDERNEPDIPESQLKAEVMRNRAYIRELARLLVQHTSATLEDVQAAKAVADAAPDWKRPR